MFVCNKIRKQGRQHGYINRVWQGQEVGKDSNTIRQEVAAGYFSCKPPKRTWGRTNQLTDQ